MPYPSSAFAGLLVQKETEILRLPALPVFKTESGEGAWNKSERDWVPSIQLGTWVLEQLQTGPLQNVICRAFSITGSLDRKALSRAFHELVARHESLRLSFRAADGPPLELPLHDLFFLEVLDCIGLSQPDQESTIHLVSNGLHTTKFDLEHGPLVRALLLARSEMDHVLFLAVHCIVADECSLAIMFAELLRLYEAFSKSNSMPADGPYSEILSLSQSILEIVNTHNVSPGNPVPDWLDWPLMEFLKDGRQSSLRRNDGGRFDFQVNAPTLLLDACKSLCVHPATVFLACFHLLLSYLSVGDDITVAVRRRNRSPESTDRIGPFASMAPVRVTVPDQPDLRTLVERVAAACIRAELLTESGVEALFDRVARQQCEFQAGFEYTEIVPEVLSCTGLTLRAASAGRTWARHEFALHVVERSGNFECSIVYDCDLFLPETICWIGEVYRRLLEVTCKSPDSQITTANLLTRHEFQEILVNRNISKTLSPPAQSVFDEINRRARHAPEAVAAVCGNHHLSYGRLNELSHRFATGLKALGIKSGDCVALCGPRDLSMLVGMVGIMLARAVYLPLDPIYPDSQISFMLEDSHAALLLTGSSIGSRFSNSHVRSLALEEIIANCADGPCALDHKVRPADFAYVMYTSGSTGRPKGVIVSHGGMWNHVWAKCLDLHLDKDDIVAQTASCSFDISIWQFLSPLIAGARVAILPDDDAIDAFRLAEQLHGCDITVWETVPVLLGLVLDQTAQLHAGFSRMPALRCVVSNAEALPADLARRFHSLFPHVELLSTYGATETSDDATHCWIKNGLAGNGIHVPLGAPIGNAKIYVLDQDMQPVVPCVPGEIYIGGPGVAPGYQNQPALTAERFLPDSFSSLPGARMYRTGDRGRWVVDGNLEFLGRVDHQLKIRGHRVEPDEIAFVMRKHPMVQQAAVVPSKSGRTNSLAAFIVRRPETSSPVEELRVFLKASLPEYMVPALFMELAELPTTPNGKLDRKALHKLLHNDDYLAPRTATEAILAEIFAETLEREPAGVHDNFFACGGTARKAIRMISRIAAVLGVEVPLKLIFDSPSVKALAKAIDDLEHDASHEAQAGLKDEIHSLVFDE